MTNEGKEVSIIILESFGDCPLPHAFYYDTIEDALVAVNGFTTEGRLIAVKGIIEVERMAYVQGPKYMKRRRHALYRKP